MSLAIDVESHFGRCKGQRSEILKAQSSVKINNSGRCFSVVMVTAESEEGMSCGLSILNITTITNVRT